ncbi:MAG: alkaline phosphatase family protein [Chloroflexota bacterium]
MSDVDRLLAWFESGALVRPDAGVPNTVDLSRAIASLCGAPGIALSPPAQRVADAIGRADHIVFVMADGFGMNLVEHLPQDSFFRPHVAMEMQAVFPSSTAPAITSIATGRWPAAHAVPGWFTYLPDHNLIATILPFIERFSKRPLAELGVTPEQALPVPSWLPRFKHEPLCYMPAFITGSTYSNYFSDGEPQVPYEHLSAAAEAIVARIAASRAPTYTYLYVPFIDAAEHEHGPHADAVTKTLVMVERAVASLAGQVEGRARVVVSADHGLTRVAKRDQHEIKEGDPLMRLLRLPPSGEPRVPSFYAREGRADRFAAAFRDRFGDTHALLTIDEVEALRLLGPDALSPETRRRLGDFMAVSATSDAILHRPDSPMIGFHGGLLPDEMRIPLIVA